MNDRLESLNAMPSSRMIEFLSALTVDTVPPAVLGAARICLLDSLGCGLYGSTMEWSKIAAQVVYEERSQGQATVFGNRDAMAPARAAFINGIATHGIELDDLHPPGITHPGAMIVPAVLAVAEQYELSGKRMLLGLIAGYEAITRIATGMGKVGLGFHPAAIVGTAGAAIASCVTLGLTRDEILRAIGIACANAGFIRSFVQGGGAMVKRMHAGRAAESGVTACLLARRGFTAPLAALDGSFGLIEVYGGDNRNPQALTDSLGEQYSITQVWTKMYPFCGGMHTMAQALCDLRAEHGIDHTAVKGVRVGVNQRAIKVHTEVAPKDTMAAQYSMPFAAAVALIGDPKDPCSFIGEALNDPTVCELAQRVQLYPDPEMEGTGFPRNMGGAHVEVQLKNGRTLKATSWSAHGSPTSPCTESEIREKYRRLASVSMTDDAVSEVSSLVGRIETLPSVASLSNALRAGIGV